MGQKLPKRLALRLKDRGEDPETCRAFAAAVLACQRQGDATLFQRFGELLHADRSDPVAWAYLTVARMARAAIYEAGMHSRSGTHFRWASAIFAELAQHHGCRASVWWRSEQTESHRTHFRDNCDELYQRVFERVSACLLQSLPREVVMRAWKEAG